MPSSSFHNDSRDRRPGTISTRTVDTSRFYGEYHGHLVEHLELLLPALRETSESLIWTAGDSSLDNKYWFRDSKTALGAYREILDPPAMNADVTYWLNCLASKRATQSQAPQKSSDSNDNDNANPSRCMPTSTSTPTATINAAIEATTIQQRTWKLLAQDEFLRDNLRPSDTLIVSIGGNDVANAPTACTSCAMLSLVKLPACCLERSCIGWNPPCNEHCYGFGPVAMTSCCCSFPPCLGYMNHLFGTRVRHYIEQLTSKTKPKRVLVCMIYYLDEAPTPSWAGMALKLLGYDSDPERLQYLIRKMYADGTSKIHVDGTRVIPVPLFDVLDGKNSADYVSRVEPSSQGGRKMAEYLLDIIERDELQQSSNYQGVHTTSLAGSGPVESSYMLDRS